MSSEESASVVGRNALIETCVGCGASVDASEPGHYKSPSEEFKHKVCHEEGVPEAPVVDLSDEFPFECSMNRTYTCGHYAYGPPRRLPENCPKCTEGGDA
jgi:hypothetical protein